MIEFFFWEGCPSHERALAMLHEEMEALGLQDEPVRITEVMTGEHARETDFVGSPTIRVNGVDVQDPGGEPAALTCRLYMLRDGRPSPLPDREDVRDALRSLASG